MLFTADQGTWSKYHAQYSTYGGQESRNKTQSNSRDQVLIHQSTNMNLINAPRAALKSVLRKSPGLGRFKGARHPSRFDTIQKVEHTTIQTTQDMWHPNDREQ